MGGPSQSTTTTTNKIPPWAQPYASQLLNTAGNYFGTVGQPAPQQGVAPFNANQQAGIQGIKGETGASQGLANVGAGELSDTLSGKYLNPATNPYLTATYNEGARAMTNQYEQATAPSTLAAGQMATGGGPGVGGSSSYQQLASTNEQNLGQGLNDLATNIYGGNYTNERNIMAGAPGLIGQTQSALYQPSNELLGVGTLQQQQQQNVLNTGYQNQNAQRQYPFQQLGYLGNVLGQAIGNSGTQVSTGPNQGAMK
jgi:hypothetical protein